MRRHLPAREGVADDRVPARFRRVEDVPGVPDPDLQKGRARQRKPVAHQPGQFGVDFDGDLMQLPAGAQRPGERAACASQMKHPRAAGAAAFGRPARLDGAAPGLIPARFEYEANVLHILEIQVLRIGEVQARRLDAVQQKENLRGIGPRPDEFRSGIRCGDGPLGQLCSGRCALHATSLSRLEGAVAGGPGVLRGQKSDGA